jgi:hypothetical protein
MPVLGTLSSVNLIAAAGLLGNVGGVALTANANLTNNISTYTSIPVLSQFATVATSGYVSINIVANTFPALTNSVPTAYQGNIGSNTLTSTITAQSNQILCNGDLGQFEQVFFTATGFVSSNNQLIKSAINANNSNVTTTYTSQDNIITGELSDLTLAFQPFGLDLGRLGLLIDFENLDNFGSPAAVLRQIGNQSYSTPALNTALLATGISEDVAGNLGDTPWTDAEQKLAYRAMTTITGSDLLEILKLLKITTSGINTLADLLNPVKIFPNSFNTFTAPTINGLRGIYLNSQGTVNSLLETELPADVLTALQGNVTQSMPYNRLKAIIPPDQALANKAIVAALLQVKTIFNTTTPQLALAAQQLETNKGLNLINALTEPLPYNVRNYFSSTFATGTGPDGLFLLTDIIGTPTGYIINNALSNTISVLNTMTSAGAFSNLTNSTNGVYTIMQNTVDGDYTTTNTTPNPTPPPDDITEYTVTIPVGLPGAGTYGPYSSESSAISAAFVNLNANMVANVNSIVSSNSTLVGYTNTNWANISVQIDNVDINLALTKIDFANLVPGLQPTGLAISLADYGLDTTEGGASYVLESLATNTQGGQAIVSTMRESRNLERLSVAGISTNIVVSDQVVEPQAQLSSGQYTAGEAESQKII